LSESSCSASAGIQARALEAGGAVASYGLPSPHAAHGVRRTTIAVSVDRADDLVIRAASSSDDAFAPPETGVLGARRATIARNGRRSAGAGIRAPVGSWSTVRS